MVYGAHKSRSAGLFTPQQTCLLWNRLLSITDFPGRLITPSRASCMKICRRFAQSSPDAGCDRKPECKESMDGQKSSRSLGLSAMCFRGCLPCSICRLTSSRGSQSGSRDHSPASSKDGGGCFSFRLAFVILNVCGNSINTDEDIRVCKENSRQSEYRDMVVGCEVSPGLLHQSDYRTETTASRTRRRGSLSKAVAARKRLAHRTLRACRTLQSAAPRLPSCTYETYSGCTATL